MKIETVLEELTLESLKPDFSNKEIVNEITDDLLVTLTHAEDLGLVTEDQYHSFVENVCRGYEVFRTRLDESESSPDIYDACRVIRDDVIKFYGYVVEQFSLQNEATISEKLDTLLD